MARNSDENILAAFLAHVVALIFIFARGFLVGKHLGPFGIVSDVFRARVIRLTYAIAAALTAVRVPTRQHNFVQSSCPLRPNARCLPQA